MYGLFFKNVGVLFFKNVGLYFFLRSDIIFMYLAKPTASVGKRVGGQEIWPVCLSCLDMYLWIIVLFQEFRGRIIVDVIF